MICTKVNMCSSKANNLWFIETGNYTDISCMGTQNLLYGNLMGCYSHKS